MAGLPDSGIPGRLVDGGLVLLVIAVGFLAWAVSWMLPNSFPGDEYIPPHERPVIPRGPGR